MQLKAGERDEILEMERLTETDSRRVTISKALLLVLFIASGSIMIVWIRDLGQEHDNGSGPFNRASDAFVYLLPAMFALLIVTFFCYDWFVRARNRKVSHFLVVVQNAIFLGLFPLL